jgi:hypothetical protein
MTWNRTLKKAILRSNLQDDFEEWSYFAADVEHWRMVCSTKQRSSTQVPAPSTPRARWIALATGY